MDMYKINACGIYSTKYEDVTKAQRQIGKVIELACGYQGAGGAFQDMAKNYGVKVEDEVADAFVKKWRLSREKTVAFWYACNTAAIKAIENPGTAFNVGVLSFKKKGRHLLMRLPSGRCVYYRDAYTKVVTKTNKKTGKKYTQNTVHYWGVNPNTGHWGKMMTYGGKIAENATQAIARDLQAEALVKTETEGLHPVLHVHDEIAADENTNVPISLLQQIMEDTPVWADGLPVRAEGAEMLYYRK